MTPPALKAELLSQLAEPFTGEALFDCLNDLVFFLKNTRGQYVVVNQTAVDRCGLSSKEELYGRTPDEVYPDPLGQAYRAQDETVLRTGVPIVDRLELQIYPSGSQGWCVTHKQPLRGRNGSIVGIAGLSKDLQAPHEKGDYYAAVAGVVQYIHSHLDQPQRVQDLAAMADLSTYRFEHRMRRIFQLTAGQFIQKARMEAAVHRLRYGHSPIAEIALTCGYSDQSTFTRQFTQTVGISPAQFRRLATSRFNARGRPSAVKNTADADRTMTQRHRGAARTVGSGRSGRGNGDEWDSDS